MLSSYGRGQLPLCSSELIFIIKRPKFNFVTLSHGEALEKRITVQIKESLEVFVMVVLLRPNKFSMLFHTPPTT